MKTKNSAWILFAVACFVLGTLLGCDSDSRTANTPKPTGKAQPLFTPVAANLAQQKMCDKQATKKFHENDSIDNIPKSRTSISSYTSHYDPTVNVCYIHVSSTSAEKFPVVADVVYDAFSGRIYANYTWINFQNKKYWEVSPSLCEIHIPGKPIEKCNSAEQFNELTEKYFGVTQ
ncbi:MAG TPA: hypothetical protein VFE22_05045 [Edaphobacter sp.]|jgi:hypothetical protein|nr:hypothetical protein [Edaphobacter sp.]